MHLKGGEKERKMQHMLQANQWAHHRMIKLATHQLIDNYIIQMWHVLTIVLPKLTFWLW